MKIECRLPRPRPRCRSNPSGCAVSAIRQSAFGNRHSARGFSFTEVLFAVMILGIGFIMVAAMFPVAIHQTEANNQETITASVGRQAASYLNELANTLVYSPFPGTAVTQVTSSVLLPTFSTLPATLPMPSNQSALTIPGKVWSFYDYPPPTLGGVGRDTLTCIPLPAAATATGIPHAPYLWSLAASNLIQGSDHRFAWVAMYKRDFIEQGAPGSGGSNKSLPTPTLIPAPYAQVIMIGVRSRVKPAYDPANDTSVTTTPQSPFLPTLLAASISAGNVSPVPTITFTSPSPAISENAYVVISDDFTATGTDPNNGMYNGRIYRLGTLNSGNTWNFAPGEGPGLDDPSLPGTKVFVVGQELDPTNPGQYGGGAQDVTAYTTFVQTP